jgi:hypothetical protein
VQLIKLWSSCYLYVSGFLDSADAGTIIIVLAGICVVIGVIAFSVIIYRKKSKKRNVNGSEGKLMFSENGLYSFLNHLNLQY